MKHSKSYFKAPPENEDLDEVLREGKKFVQTFKRKADNEFSQSDGEVEYKDGKPVCQYG